LREKTLRDREQFISAFRACCACHQLSATTATASSSATTCTTPRRFAIAAASCRFSLPPNTGQARIAACGRPGRFTSAPNTGLPAILSGTARHLTRVPSRCHSSGSLRDTSSGSFRCAAAAATTPKRRVRPEGMWAMTLSAARHSSAGTSQRLAAAPISSSRAAVPAMRR